MSTLNRMQLIQDLEKNLLGKFSYLQKQCSDMEVIDQDSLLIINSNQMTDMFNIICCYGNVSREQVDNAIHYFKSKKIPFAWWVGFENETNDLTTMLEKHGLKRSEEELAMAIQLDSEFNFTAPKSLLIKKVNDTKTMEDYIYVITDIVPNEKNAIENFYHKAEKFILHDNASTELYVGYVDSQPISTCSVFFTEHAAGIYDIIASPKIRGMGIGSAMTQAAMKAALDKGYEICILTATNDAKFLYEKLGFQALKSMCVYS